MKNEDFYNVQNGKNKIVDEHNVKIGIELKILEDHVVMNPIILIYPKVNPLLVCSKCCKKVDNSWINCHFDRWINEFFGRWENKLEPCHPQIIEYYSY